MSLPEELILKIIIESDVGDLKNLCKTNTQFHDICKNNRQYIIKHLLEKYQVDYTA